MSKGLNEMSFGSMETPFGPCNLHVMYRNACQFHLETQEMNVMKPLGDFDDVYFVPSFNSSGLPSFDVNENQVSRERDKIMENVNEKPLELIQTQQPFPFPPIRKASNTSLSTEMSSEPPKSLTSPAEFPLSLQTNLSSKTSLLNPKASRNSLLLQGSSLPSPSYLAFTPPSAPSSLKSDAIKVFGDEPPPFALQDPPHSLPLQSFPTHSSPPFALPGSSVLFISYSLYLNLKNRFQLVRVSL